MVMNKSTQLLCTFCNKSDLEEVLQLINDYYNVSMNTIYVLENLNDDTQLCCTYNVEILENQTPLNSTISLHRKKITNTLYTINALNLLVSELNNGVTNSHFELPWSNYKNCILVTAHGKLKIIKTKLLKKVEL